MFNLKEFIVNNLINGVKNKSFSKEYASILATNYLLKGILAEEDIIRFDEETTVEEVVETPVENEQIEETLDEVAEEIVEEIVENTEDNAEV